MSDSQLLQAQFTVTAIDDTKYDRCLRLQADAFDADGHPIKLSLDLNHELFPVAVDDRLDIVVASTLDLAGGQTDDASAGISASRSNLWQEVVTGRKATLADQFDYVCFGKVYRADKSASDPKNITILISFGGLLMQLDGPSKAVMNIKIGEAYLLVRKVK